MMMMMMLLLVALLCCATFQSVSFVMAEEENDVDNPHLKKHDRRSRYLESAMHGMYDLHSGILDGVYDKEFHKLLENELLADEFHMGGMEGYTEDTDSASKEEVWRHRMEDNDREGRPSFPHE
ncbi:uncharacterized protein LOC135388145 [Ornithodoros turicata]|uniref:uncharacterized protein LOC135388145 n=1 Tax=Ornithodoros turicata TaxID=34597 RepID=UPI00313A2C88